MISATWKTIKDVVLSFISDEALTGVLPSPFTLPLRLLLSYLS